MTPEEIYTVITDSADCTFIAETIDGQYISGIITCGDSVHGELLLKFNYIQNNFQLNEFNTSDFEIEEINLTNVSFGWILSSFDNFKYGWYVTYPHDIHELSDIIIIGKNNKNILEKKRKIIVIF